MFVKICGITREEDFALVSDSDADACGFVAWPASGRFVSPERFQAILASAPSSRTPRVVVFVDPSPDDIARYADLGANIAQLHGDESPEITKKIPKGVEVWKAVKPLDFSDIERMAGFPADKFLLDSFTPQRGGSGVRCDWGLASMAVSRLGKPVLLAGGINAANILDAARTVRPFGFDVSSGVESSPGVKDKKLVLDFIKRVKSISLPAL